MRIARSVGRVAIGVIVAALVGGPLGARALGAQVAGEDSTARWRGTGELAGTVLFGAARQRTVAGTVAAGRGDRVRAERVELQAGYGDAVGTEADAVRRVVVRNARLSGGVDWRPSDRVSPFTFALVESSLQQRIAQRASGGVGAKYTIWRRGTAEDLSASLALLAEETRALDGPSAGDGTRVRWSLRLRARRQLDARWRLTHVTFWQPTVNRVQRFTVETTTQLASALRDGLELTASLRDRYDSEARRRGARSNHDGQLLFGVRVRY